MARFDVVLIAPSAQQLVDSLVKATQAANDGINLLALQQHHWEEFLPQLREHREGRRQWSDSHRGETARVCITWWRDHVGRLHVRILAGNSRDGSYRTLTSTRTDRRAPLWHLYPDRVFFRENDEHAEWIVVCQCGMAGPPEKIGWMGKRCGPCHDRQVEGESLQEINHVSEFSHHGMIPPVFSGDGRYLATVIARVVDVCHVSIVAITESKRIELIQTRDGPHAMVFNPTGTMFACSYPYSRLVLHDLQTQEVLFDDSIGMTINDLAFSRTGETLAVGGPDGVALFKRGQSPGNWQMVSTLECAGSVLSFSPTRDELAVGNQEGIRFFHLLNDTAIDGSAIQTDWEHAILDLVYDATGEELVCIQGMEVNGAIVAIYPEPRSIPAALVRYDRTGARVSEHRLQGSGSYALSPDGKMAAGTFYDSPRALLIPVETPVQSSWIAWDLERPLTQVTFSSDNQTLAMINDRGEGKLIPWRFLLESLPSS